MHYTSVSQWAKLQMNLWIVFCDWCANTLWEMFMSHVYIPFVKMLIVEMNIVYIYIVLCEVPRVLERQSIL